VADQARGRLGLGRRAENGASSGGSGTSQPWRPAPVGERGLVRPCASVGFSVCWLRSVPIRDEPFGDLPGLWREVPPSSDLIVQPGAYEEVVFRSAAPVSAGSARSG
jgi:hypothetical protein